MFRPERPEDAPADAGEADTASVQPTVAAEGICIDGVCLDEPMDAQQSDPQQDEAAETSEPIELPDGFANHEHPPETESDYQPEPETEDPRA